MKVFTKRISKWAYLSFWHKRFSSYLHLKFEKEIIFLVRFSTFEILILRTKSFKIGFQVVI